MTSHAEMPPQLHRQNCKRKRSGTFAILLFISSANRCAGFTTINSVGRPSSTTGSISASSRTKSQLFDQRGPPNTQDDRLFFAQDLLLDQSDDTFYGQDMNDSASQSLNEDFFYAQPSAPSETQSGGMDAYEAQFAAMNSQVDQNVVDVEVSNDPYDNWKVPEDQVTNKAPEQTGDTSGPPSSDSSSQAISDLDARVLESILQEGKLDLSSEEQVKKLLEGPRIVEEGTEDTNPSSGTGEYSSKFVSKISDNGFWNSFKAKATEVLESVQIYIENRIERDVQTLGAVGIFAFERVKRDIVRALPVAGRQVKKLLLASNSTYAEKLVEATEKTVLALPTQSSYEELTTAADEIKQVTEAIRDILAGKELPATSAASQRRGVKSIAPAGTSRMAERQQRAYQARKKTVLQREKEGIDRTLGRAIGSMSDATWELRQEMSSGVGREAGYRSKGVRRALAAGAVKMLNAGRESSRRLLGRGKENLMLDGDADDARGEYAKSANVEYLDVDAVKEEQIIDDVIVETNLDYAPDGLLSPESYIEEKRRLIASLESCLSQPGQTWLTKEIVAQATDSGIGLDGDMLRQVITNMVTLRDELREELIEEDNGERDYLKIDYVQNELRRMKGNVDSVANLAVAAAGEGAATLLKSELEGFVLSDSLDEIIEIELERLEQLLAEMVATREREIQSQPQGNYIDYSASDVEVITQVIRERKQSTQANNGMFTEVEVEPRSTDQAFYMQEDTYPDSGEYSSSTVEVISDDEYFEYEQQFKTAQSSDLIEDDDVIQEDNPAVKFVLRVVDAIFFVGEKLFLVVLPNMMSTGSNASYRFSQAQNRGNGSAGWLSLKNLKSKKNQY